MYFVPLMKTLVLLDTEIIGSTSSVKTKLIDLQRISLLLPLTNSQFAEVLYHFDCFGDNSYLGIISI